jgi:hypothetical protein
MRRENTKSAHARIMHKVLSSPRYKGKHVIVVANKILTAKTGDGAAKILHDVDKKYPHETAAVTYIPDADTLIL